MRNLSLSAYFVCSLVVCIPVFTCLYQALYISGTNPINQTAATVVIVVANPMICLPLFPALYVLQRFVPNKSGIERLALSYKFYAGFAMAFCAIAYENAYVALHFVVKCPTTAVECVLFVYLALLAFETRKLGKRTGVKTPWMIPTAFAALVAAGTTVGMIAN